MTPPRMTAGPWRRCGGMTGKYIAVVDANDNYIVYQMGDARDQRAPDDDTQRINAEAIAKLPEMVAFLRALQVTWYNGRSVDPDSPLATDIGALLLDIEG
jgi:hypothetical protein